MLMVLSWSRLELWIHMKKVDDERVMKCIDLRTNKWNSTPCRCLNLKHSFSAAFQFSLRLFKLTIW